MLQADREGVSTVHAARFRKRDDDLRPQGKTRPVSTRRFISFTSVFFSFVTFTGNPQWPEIQALLSSPSDTWLNHPQEVARIFADKAYEFLTDILERDVLGKVTAYAISTELQMRGMPHLHCLFTLADDTPGLGEAQYVDEYISAELPDLPEDWRYNRSTHIAL